jgi:hypothetical protein
VTLESMERNIIVLVAEIANRAAADIASCTISKCLVGVLLYTSVDLPRGVVVYLKRMALVVQASDPLHGIRQRRILSVQPCQLRSEKQSLRSVPFAMS